MAQHRRLMNLLPGMLQGGDYLLDFHSGVVRRPARAIFETREEIHVPVRGIYAGDTWELVLDVDTEVRTLRPVDRAS